VSAGAVVLGFSLTALAGAARRRELSTVRRFPMYVRAVRFSGVTAERMKQLEARINEAGGPPPGVAATGLKVLFDERQGTAVVLQDFATAADMEAGAKVFAAMDPSETPGTRASVDECEVKLDLKT
jgi:hypothetical protein